MDDWEEITAKTAENLRNGLVEEVLPGGVKAGHRGKNLSYIKDYLIQSQIGYGTYGKTYIGIKNGREYVIKEVEKPYGENEIKALKQIGLNCTRYVNCPVEIITGFGTSFLVTEYIHGSNLERYCSQENSRSFRRNFLAQMMSALDFLHKSEVYHRNITPKNIIYVEPAQRFYLIDFSLSCFGKKQLLGFATSKPSCPTGECVGTPLFAPNSYFMNCGSSVPDKIWFETMQANDTFALGVVAFLLAENKWPWPVTQNLLYEDRETIVTTRATVDEYNLLVDLLKANFSIDAIYGTNYEYFKKPEDKLDMEPVKSTMFVYFASLDPLEVM